ncbi:MAG: Gfo/Idh/MocA family protein [Halobacteriaceae archaeon]
MTDSVTVAVVGVGGMGHGHAGRAVEAGADLVAGVDVDADARERFAEEYGVETFADDAAMHEAVDPDAVIVATPNAFHADSAVAALERDVSVLVEKPLAADLEDAERIAAAAEASSAFCMVGFHNRYEEVAEVLRAAIDDGDLGEVRHVEANYRRRRGIPGLGSWFTSRELAGGGALIDVGVHVLDLSLHALDFPEVVEVTGVARSDFGSRADYSYLSMYGPDGDDEFDVEDAALGFVRCGDGSTITLNVAWATNDEPDHTVRVHGTEGGAVLDVTEDDLTFYETTDRGASHHVDADVTVGSSDGHQAEVDAFVGGVAAGEAPSRNTVEQGLTVQRVMDGLYRSSEAGHAIRLDG